MRDILPFALCPIIGQGLTSLYCWSSLGIHPFQYLLTLLN